MSIGTIAIGTTPIGTPRRGIEAPERVRPQVHILSIPRVNVNIETANNEDWLDTLQYYAAGDFEFQLDLRSFHFDMHLRREPRDREIIVEATTINQRLSIGAEPFVGTLIIYVPEHVMETKFPGRYVGDIRANKDGITRVVVNINLELINGITRLAFPH